MILPRLLGRLSQMNQGVKKWEKFLFDLHSCIATIILAGRRQLYNQENRKIREAKKKVKD